MEIGQWIATFASHGVDNMNSGDMIWSYSPGIKNDIRANRIPSIMGYPELIENRMGEMPDVIRVNTRELEQGNIYFSSSHFIGENHDGTPGRGNNYISHCFRIKDPDFYPIELYQWDQIRVRLTEEEENLNYRIPLLDDYTEVQWKEIQRAQQNRKDSLLKKLDDFFCGDADYSNRSEWLCYLIEAVLNKDEQNLVILYDKAENIPLWIAAVSFSLPVKCAQRISFNTFCPDPFTQNYDIRGVAAGFEQEDISIYKNRNQHYFFDMLHGKMPSHYMCREKKGIPFDNGLPDLPFYQCVRECWDYDISSIAYNPDCNYRLKEFHQFLNEFRDFDQINNEIKDAATLFEMLTANKFFSFGNEERKRALDFQNRYHCDRELLFVDMQNRTLDELLKKQFYDLQHSDTPDSEQNRAAFHQFFQVFLKEIPHSTESHEKKAEQYLKLYYLLTINCIMVKKSDQDAFCRLENQMKEMIRDIKLKNISEENVLGCAEEIKNQQKKQVTYQQMPVFLAEYCSDSKIFEKLRWLFALQMESDLLTIKKEKYVILIRQWIHVTEKNFKDDESELMRLYKVMDKKRANVFIEEMVRNSTYPEGIQKRLIRKYCEENIPVNKKYPDIIDSSIKELLEKDLGKVAGISLALILEKMDLKNQIEQFKSFFDKFFIRNEENWKYLDFSFESIIHSAQNLNSHETVFTKIYGLFLYLLQRTNGRFRTPGLEKLIHLIALNGSTVNSEILSEILIYDDSRAKYVHTFCRMYELFRDEDMNQIRSLIYLSQIAHVRDQQKWITLWKQYYEEYPVYIKIKSEKEQKLYEKYMENVLKKTWFNLSGYRMLLEGAQYEESMFKTMEKVIADGFRSRLINAVHSTGDLKDMLSLLAALEIPCKFRPDYRSVLKEETGKLKAGTIDRICKEIKELKGLNKEQKEVCRQIFERFVKY